MKIVLSTVTALLLLGCSDGAKDSVQEKATTQTAAVVEKSKAVAQDVKEVATESTTAVKEVAKEVTAEVQEKSKEVVKQVEAKSTELVKEAEAKIDEARTDLAKAIEPEKKVVPAAPVKVAVDGAVVYKTCVACHGANAEKKALNKSQVIQGWESKKIVAALNGYKDGSYGGSMKGVMKPQVSKLSDAEIEAVAKHISSL